MAGEQKGYEKYDRLGGWLIVFAVIFILNIIFNIPAAMNAYKLATHFKSHPMPEFESIAYSYFNALTFGYALLLLYGGYVIYCYFRLKPGVAALVIAYLVCDPILAWSAPLYFNLMLPGDMAAKIIDTLGGYRNAIGTSGYALVWIVYFQQAERVKKTFGR